MANPLSTPKISIGYWFWVITHIHHLQSCSASPANFHRGRKESGSFTTDARATTFACHVCSVVLSFYIPHKNLYLYDFHRLCWLSRIRTLVWNVSNTKTRLTISVFVCVCFSSSDNGRLHCLPRETGSWWIHLSNQELHLPDVHRLCQARV